MLQNRLLESLAKFQEYEDTLESIMKNLDAFEPIINEEVESPVNLKVAQQQLESVRVKSLINVTQEYYWKLLLPSPVLCVVLQPDKKLIQLSLCAAMVN
jgi:hypothetical protein